jgi:hypothetical protein
MTNQEALFHLALLGMYADGSLKLSEDDRIDNLLTELGWEADAGVRAATITQAYSRVRDVSGDDEKTAAFITTKLKPALSGEGDKDRAMALLQSVVSVDGDVSSAENTLIGLVKWML